MGWMLLRSSQTRTRSEKTRKHVEECQDMEKNWSRLWYRLWPIPSVHGGAWFVYTKTTLALRVGRELLGDVASIE